MRLFIAMLAVLGVVLIGGAPTAAAAADFGYELSSTQQGAQPPAGGQFDVNVDVDEGGGWWADPVWIGVGIIALILLVVIIAMASRGGGTTVVKD